MKKQLKEPDWQDKSSGKSILNMKDTCRVIIEPDGERFYWELVLPGGHIKDGFSDTLAEAKKAWEAPYREFILESWPKGFYDQKARWCIQF